MIGQYDGNFNKQGSLMAFIHAIARNYKITT
jgi:hypothetical protein